jgi:hypothetical protein
MPEKPADANPPVPATSGDSPPTPPGATSDMRVPTPERKSTALTGFGYPSK